ncbi:SgcJ/EcaC family oxidoreductase [Streptomyces sp. NBC_01281]|uniref:SgcJ/EcaC family oxidoreductase n=1 Tax=Streptomyces sp. NBC_01281 TaxID=2903811 RepID=UPI002E1506F4|nr:SgcJ/EcaC family oxidoreductase [Streptomyces sp. NBC_01281]
MTTNRTHTADETAILKVLENVYAAWDTYDADAFVADYTEDASVILPGSYRSSREEIRQSMQAGFTSYLKGSTTSNKVLDIRFLTKDAAAVILPFPAGSGSTWRSRRGRPARVSRRGRGCSSRWQVAAYQNSPKAAATS